MTLAKCRFCDSPLEHTFCDLGMSPVSNANLKEEMLRNMEPFYPLHVQVCKKCYLVQLQEFEAPSQIFNDEYAYFSSYSDSWLKHAKVYTEKMIDRFHLARDSQVIEIASNDGYLLQYFNERNIPSLGVEPSGNCADVAQSKGIETWVRFFGVKTAQEIAEKNLKADLLLGNNVLAHVPDINDFVAGLKLALKEDGVITMEFPHLVRLIENNQFDTIYHEHFSYLSLIAVVKIFSSHGMTIFDVEELNTHGGSLRIYAKHDSDTSKQVSDSVEKLLEREIAFGLNDVGTYMHFSTKVEKTKRQLLSFLIEAKNAGKKIAGYGAPAKGNTLLNYCGVRTDFIDFTVDRSPHKQGKYLPGSHIPVYQPEKILLEKPDYLLVLPWNLKDEIIGQMQIIKDWGGKFVIPIPEVVIL